MTSTKPTLSLIVTYFPEENLQYINIDIPLVPMGVLAPGSAHVGPSAQPPIGISGIIAAGMSAESPSNISPNSLEVISEVSEP